MIQLKINADEWAISFDQGKAMADQVANILLSEPMILSWYDRDRDLEAPSHVSECHDACDTPGYLDYARNRGGKLTVDISDGRFVFCYRALEEFSDFA